MPIIMAASSTESGFTLSWTDPSYEGFTYIRLDYDSFSINVAAGIQTVTVSGLNESARYPIKLYSIDGSGKLSTPATTALRTAASGSTYSFTVVDSAEELAAITRLQDIILTADIDLSDYGYWTPLCSSLAFWGSMDGGGHVISGLKINDSGSGNQGLFASSYGVDFLYVVLEDVSITGGDATGALVGDASSGPAFTGCVVTGEISGGKYVGGLAGRTSAASSSPCTFTDCGANVKMTSSGGYCGGLAGQAISTSFYDCSASGTIECSGTVSGGLAGSMSKGSAVDCSSSVAITGSSDCFGALAGSAYSMSFENCSATGSVSSTGSSIGGLLGYSTDDYTLELDSCFATGDVSGADSVGGLIGLCKAVVTATNCRATGKVMATGSCSGGLVGTASDSTDASAFTSCYATGSVSGVGALGGLAGAVQYVDFSDCYALGDVSGTGARIGGLIGRCYEATVLHCRSAGDVSCTSDGYYSGGLIGYCAYDALVSQCYATGDVSGMYFVGGLIGDLDLSSVAVNCYARGAVTGVSNTVAAGLVAELGSSTSIVSGSTDLYYSYSTGAVSDTGQYACGAIGAILDTNGATIVSGVHYDSQTSGKSDTTGNSIANTSDEMKASGTYSGWDFDAIWAIDDSVNDGYPYLRNNPPAS